MPRLVVLDAQVVNPGDLSWAPLQSLGELSIHDRTADADVVARSREADVVITNKTRLPAEVLAQLPLLRGVSVLATGFDVVDAAAARARGVPVCNVPAYSTASVAQHTLALLLELTQHVGLHASAVRNGAWSKQPDFSFFIEPLEELDGRTFGIVGLGAIGRRVAGLAQALGMQVIATPSRRQPEPPAGVRTRPLADLFAESDVLSLHCPLVAETERLVRRERLQSMKPTALLLNTARGALIDEGDLAAALHAGRLGGAALDVLSREPPNADHPLLSAPRCLVTPHQAWTTRAARERLLRATVDNVAGILSGRPVNLVNG
jgi:glycerate dehydrogenase